jgi:antirestriction protein
MDEFRVWIGCLACYNAGRLVGQWYDASEAGEVTTSRVHGRDMTYWVKSHDGRGSILRRHEMHEELWCFDIEAPHESLAREMSPMEAAQIAEVLADAERRYIEVAPFLAWLDNQGYAVDGDHFSDFEDAYCGEWKDEEDYAYQLAEDLGAVPEGHSWPASYVDWQRAARDLFMDHTAIRSPGGIWVFRD